MMIKYVIICTSIKLHNDQTLMIKSIVYSYQKLII